ncbi:autolysin AtlA [Streptococcus suis]|uniref:autolysin AtlA n=1 Tax=Streptococcus suis TaxID=1307 RepID=UPI001C943D0F|nr:GBS Bsp-like repeat-containing protein [Streptococcus suis]MBY4956646.1 GBS Bsp-like repeat-containing protein [Streptococcus suis]MBY4971626.1 GBS Bsp-like repeat-containing protein [Streptococcus suis]MBY4982559.1 GBS Bsp-like repeat-containing protein [Streptococcus suis]MBY4993251.1 GBS Bsp-like repeat-containing protein [Streptococcus suis]MBY5008718.1 GBS Bsp-like repeat-containing protein [Streptococcus suis]
MRSKYMKSLGLGATCLLAMSVPVAANTTETNQSSDASGAQVSATQATSSEEITVTETNISSSAQTDTSTAATEEPSVSRRSAPETEESSTTEASSVTSSTSITSTTTTQTESAPATQAEATIEQALYRLYQPDLRVHLYTKDANEYAVLAGRGWRQEGEAWRFVSNQGEPVYRLYQPDLRVHLYTKDANEYAVLAGRGWRQEGEAFRSHGNIPVYRLYHPGLRVHLYTKDANEYTVLAGRGWRQEGIAFYGLGSAGSSTASNTPVAPQVAKKPTGTVSIQNKNSQNGNFDIIVSNVDSPLGVSSVLVPVWSDEKGQDDLVWYEAARQADGSYKVSVQSKNHGYSTGTYQVHLYLVQKDGTKIGISPSTTTTVEIKDTVPKATVRIENIDRTYGFFDVRITDLYVPKGIESIQAAVWADVGGQNDVQHYEATKQSDGSYLVPVRISNHKYEQGNYNISLSITSQGQKYNVAQANTSISYTKTEIPRFIDVSSHNGTLSVADYKTLAANGISGVVVKLSEAVSYLNPYAEGQVKNALAAGLKVSVYHYSHFTSKEEAKAEAQYFVAAAKKLGLPTSTLMVNDIEEYATRKNINDNMKAWEEEMRRLGYSNLIHYTGASWLDDNSLGVVGPIQTSQFGMTNFWVAQYPYSTMTPAQAMSMSLHARTAAWQYTSKATLLPGRSFFDVNLDYTNRFTK